ncbi:MAG: cupredoxin domain-containing protein [Candidatus Levybacteria bacterium]|nr:cupredoxin domain-containing protein [Candidatus Levybacteria bacterium]
MGNKLALGFLALILIIGAVLILGNSSAPKQNTPIPVQTAPTNAKDTQNVTTITLTNASFLPKTVTVKTGTKVKWTNKSGELATVDSADHPAHRVYLPLNLGQFANNESLELVFDKPGKYLYHNHLGPERTGTVVVE